MDIIISKRSLVAGLFGKEEYITYMGALMKSFFITFLFLPTGRKKKREKK